MFSTTRQGRSNTDFQKWILIIGTVICVYLGNSCRADQITLSGDSVTFDSTLYANDPNGNNGEGVINRAGRAGNATNLRRLTVKFDFPSVLYDGNTASIDSVQLKLVVTNIPNTGPASSNQSLYRIISSWSEGTGLGSGNTGQVVEGGVSWNYRVYSTLPWSVSSGGDFSATTSATTSVSTTGGVGSVIAWSSSGMRSDVQGWLNGTFDNNGWILLGDEATNNSVRGYGGAEDISSNQPALTISYTPNPVAVELSVFEVKAEG